MVKKKVLIVGGTGQFGLYLANFLIKKKLDVYITSRKITKNYKKNIAFFGIKKKIKIIIFKDFKYDKAILLLNKVKPDEVYYFAGQSSVFKSFKSKQQTYSSNTLGCKIFLKAIKDTAFKCKFINASSSDIFGNHRKKINLLSKKTPLSPYGKAKLESFNITKNFREKHKVKSYNAIIFNTESYLRPKNFLIPKICLSAIDAHLKKNKNFYFGDLNVQREWNWCEDQVKYLWKFVQKKPQDFLLTNGISYSAKELAKYAFDIFKYDFKNYIRYSNKFIRPSEINSIKSDLKSQERKSKIKIYSKNDGKKIIKLLISFYFKKIKNKGKNRK